jgi:hypothetical protein
LSKAVRVRVGLGLGKKTNTNPTYVWKSICPYLTLTLTRIFDGAYSRPKIGDNVPRLGLELAFSVQGYRVRVRVQGSGSGQSYRVIEL